MSRTRSTTRTSATALPVALLLGLAATLAGCGGGENAADTPQADAITVTDPWVKAADEGMTGAFAVLSSDSEQDVRIVEVASEVSARGELHETVSADGGTVMREKDGGLVLPAGAEHELAPGGDHLMLMELTGPGLPGPDVSVTLTMEDGSELTFTAPARTFSGGQEEYVPSGEDHGAMDGDS